MKTQTPITTNLNEIRKHDPCGDGWIKLLKYLGKTEPDDEPLALLTILDSNGLYDCLWTFRCLPEMNWLWRHLAVDFACHSLGRMTDPRSIEALRVARRFADGEATGEELRAAKDRAGAANAAWAAAAARSAYWAAARSAYWAASADAYWAAVAVAVAAAGAARAAVRSASSVAAGAAGAAEAAAEAEAAFSDHLRATLEAGERVIPNWEVL